MQDVIIINHVNTYKVIIITVQGKYGITFLSLIAAQK